MRWTVHGERSLYESEWVNLRLVDVEVPGGERFEHHVVRHPRPAAGVVVTGEDRSSVLLLWRHRFITDTWGWEIPAGRVAAGATHVGDPTDWSESERVEWLEVDRVREAITAGEVGDGMSLTGLCWALAFGHVV